MHSRYIFQDDDDDDGGNKGLTTHIHKNFSKEHRSVRDFKNLLSVDAGSVPLLNQRFHSLATSYVKNIIFTLGCIK